MNLGLSGYLFFRRETTEFLISSMLSSEMYTHGVLYWTDPTSSISNKIKDTPNLKGYCVDLTGECYVESIDILSLFDDLTITKIVYQSIKWLPNIDIQSAHKWLKSITMYIFLQNGYISQNSLLVNDANDTVKRSIIIDHNTESRISLPNSNISSNKNTINKPIHSKYDKSSSNKFIKVVNCFIYEVVKAAYSKKYTDIVMNNINVSIDSIIILDIIHLESSIIDFKLSSKNRNETNSTNFTNFTNFTNSTNSTNFTETIWNDVISLDTGKNNVEHRELIMSDLNNPIVWSKLYQKIRWIIKSRIINSIKRENRSDIENIRVIYEMDNDVNNGIEEIDDKEELENINSFKGQRSKIDELKLELREKNERIDKMKIQYDAVNELAENRLKEILDYQSELKTLRGNIQDLSDQLIVVAKQRDDDIISINNILDKRVLEKQSLQKEIYNLNTVITQIKDTGICPIFDKSLDIKNNNSSKNDSCKLIIQSDTDNLEDIVSSLALDKLYNILSSLYLDIRDQKAPKIDGKQLYLAYNTLISSFNHPEIKCLSITTDKLQSYSSNTLVVFNNNTNTNTNNTNTNNNINNKSYIPVIFQDQTKYLLSMDNPILSSSLTRNHLIELITLLEQISPSNTRLAYFRSQVITALLSK